MKKIANKIARKFRNAFLVDKKSKAMRPREELQTYWREPWKWDESNIAEDYVRAGPRTKFLLSFFKDIPKSARILEIGCNSGRNLNGLWLEGYKNVTGIEISPHAVDVMKSAYPNMKIPVHTKPVEEAIRGLGDGQFDVVFTMAVLEHLPPESEWVFKDMVRITSRYIITIEDERGADRRHCPRNYKEVFEKLGMKQIQEMNCAEVDDLFDPAFNARIFIKTK